jgi:DNA-directed RNA polymerase subunit RPC12/RpoP
MGASYIYECNKCAYTFHTSGPWEFYRNHEGELKDYGHPAPNSKEAKLMGIKGLYGEMYCNICDKVSKIILVEFKNPSKSSLSVWTNRCEPEDKYQNEGAIKCPECGNKNLILQVEEKEIFCPHCKEGKMKGRMEWIS